MDGSNAAADERGATPLRRLPKPVVGVMGAIGAVSLGLVLIGACGLGHQDTYVAPPPMNADLQAAPETSKTSATPAVVIPPSPTWRVAVDQPPRHSYTPFSSTTSLPGDPYADDPLLTTTPRTTWTRPTAPRTTSRPESTYPTYPFTPSDDGAGTTSAPPTTTTDQPAGDDAHGG